MRRVITEAATAMPEAADDITTTGTGTVLSKPAIPVETLNTSIAVLCVQISAPSPRTMSDKPARMPA